MKVFFTELDSLSLFVFCNTVLQLELELDLVALNGPRMDKFAILF